MGFSIKIFWIQFSFIRFSHKWKPVIRVSVRVSLKVIPWRFQIGIPRWYPETFLIPAQDWLLHASCWLKWGFLKNPNLEVLQFWKFSKNWNLRFFNLKKLQAEVLSFYKDLGIYFHCYLLSTVREKIYRNLPWWKEILTIQNSWSFLWIEKKPVIFTLERDRCWGHSVFSGEAPQNTEWPPDWAAS